MRTTGKATDLITFSRSSGGTALRKIAYGSDVAPLFSAYGIVGSGTWAASGSDYVFEDTVGSQVRPGVSWPTNGLSAGIYLVEVNIASITGATQVRVDGIGAADQLIGTGENSFVIQVTSKATLRIRIEDTSTSVGDGFALTSFSVKPVLFDQGDLTLFNHPADIPRVEYDANGNVLGLLVEEARVNLFPNSEAIDVTLNSQQQVSVSDVSITEGVYQGTWRNITEDTSTNQHRLVSGSSINITPNVSYTFSALVKRTSGLRDVQFTLFNAGDSVAGNFSLSNETATTESAGSATAQSASIENLGNGVYLVSVTGIVSTTATSCFELIRLTDDGTKTYTGDGTSSVAITAMQLEQGSFKTSYIPTSGSTATRAADVASIAISEFGYRQDEGTVVMEFQTTGGADETGTYYYLSGNDTNARWAYHNSPDSFKPYDGSAAPNLILTQDNNVFYKFAIAADQSTFSGAIDGGLSVNNNAATGNLTSLTTAFKIGSSHTDANQMTGHIKSIKYIPRRLTNDQLQEITS